jgi:hypothetical protein
MEYNPNTTNVSKADADRRDGVVRRGRFHEPF